MTLSVFAQQLFAANGIVRVSDKKFIKEKAGLPKVPASTMCYARKFIQTTPTKFSMTELRKGAQIGTNSANDVVKTLLEAGEIALSEKIKTSIYYTTTAKYVEDLSIPPKRKGTKTSNKK